MDSIDRKILAELQMNGRLTLTHLASQVQLSVSQCQRRVRELERQEVIRGYRALVDPARVGLGFEVLGFVTLKEPSAVERFDAAIEAVPEIIEAQRLFGSPDYLLRVVTTDRDAYQTLYDTVLIHLPGLQGFSSTIVMKQAVHPRPLPLTKRTAR